ncbi:acetyl-CoA carboxylase biotin carboxyl carrier protein [Tengunoibacter tsumagoiensis]|uniref:Acetyl-CoA carboxylase biotin carboxyl carrier protein subunit n=1 Tax=Tengunoibacter tsumagoiensis TaxID=2014871 RepID=A0A401ZXY2_9CHLR|nr:biotin/lipoyl-containing protein [Tengunoibacter tsumagoiensis]GCE11728.1 acetyl-CoA carboxylase biotin carboxyl carrier protein subunit [Tengunoibacter tsumagoiensis]
MDNKSQYSYEVDAFTTEERPAVEHVGVEQLQRLVHLLDGSDVSEIEVKRVEEGMRLVLRKARASHAGEGVSYLAPVVADEEELTEEAPLESKYTVKASLVGIFHTWAKPKGKDMVTVGDPVKIGQVLGSIQSLNVLSEVESPVAGHVVEFLVQNGHAVEYGQPLLVIDTAEGA